MCQTPTTRITIHCEDCGSQEVMRDAFAVWNPELQMWEISSLYDDWFCPECEAETHVVERKIEDETP